MELFIFDYEKNNLAASFDDLMEAVGDSPGEYIKKAAHEDGRKLRLSRQLLFDEIVYRKIGNISPAISKNEYGKPYFLPPLDKYEFNISHSGSLVVMGFGDEAIGVDVERTDRETDIRRLLRFFSYDEAARVDAADDERDEFYRIWTYREAFSKLVGVGLPLFEDKSVHIDYASASVEYGGRTYEFFEYNRQGYRITACIEAGEKKPKLTEILLSDMKHLDTGTTEAHSDSAALSYDEIITRFGLEKKDIRTYSPVALAYIGDTIYDLIVRSHIMGEGSTSVNNMNKKAAAKVSAVSQSAAYDRIEPLLSDAERDILRRGKNAHKKTSAKNASIADYHKSTGLEALIGYLYMTGQIERIYELMEELF